MQKVPSFMQRNDLSIHTREPASTVYERCSMHQILRTQMKMSCWTASEGDVADLLEQRIHFFIQQTLACCHLLNCYTGQRQEYRSCARCQLQQFQVTIAGGFPLLPSVYTLLLNLQSGRCPASRLRHLTSHFCERVVRWRHESIFGRDEPVLSGAAKRDNRLPWKKVNISHNLKKDRIDYYVHIGCWLSRLYQSCKLVNPCDAPGYMLIRPLVLRLL